jgi:hypothetical protein
MKLFPITTICSSLIVCFVAYTFLDKINYLIRCKKSARVSNKLTNTYPEQKIIFLKSNKIIDIHKNYTNDNSWRLKYYHDSLLIKEIDILPNNCNEQNISEILFGDSNSKIKNKLINITPGGIYGYYDAGITKILKDKFDLRDCIFSGASAGSWNSLFMVYKRDNHGDIMNNIFEINFSKSDSIKNLQLKLKEKILSNYKTEDFDLDRLFISVCVYENYSLNNYIYTDFQSLEEAIDCCVASSNIPLLTGNIIFKYKNKISFDGGFLSNPYILFIKPIFTITYTVWGRNRFYTSLFNKIDTNLKNLYLEGQADTIDNINHLDKIFSKS